MDRRRFFGTVGQGAALAALMGCGRLTERRAEAHPLAPPARDPLKITRVRAILTAPARTRLVAVRVDTSEPGLYGLGCATFKTLLYRIRERRSAEVEKRSLGNICHPQLPQTGRNANHGRAAGAAQTTVSNHDHCVQGTPSSIVAAAKSAEEFASGPSRQNTCWPLVCQEPARPSTG